MDNKIKILVISFLFPNRIHQNHGIFVLNRLKALSKYVDIKVINPLPCSPLHRFINRYKNYSLIPEIDVIGGLEVYHPRYLSIPKYCKFIEPLTYSRSVEKVVLDKIKDFEFDIVDMHWTFPDLTAGLKISKRYNKPSIVTLRGMEALHVDEGDSREKYVQRGLVEVGHIISLSNELRQQGEIISGNKAKSKVIINGVDTENFKYVSLVECRNKLGINKDELIILSVGSLIKRKGFDVLIRALSLLKNKSGLNNIKLYIVGSEGHEGDFRSELFDLVKSLKLETSVVFVGQVPNYELISWYNAADVFCLSSRGEGSPNVLSEAMSCGCPVVSTDVGSSRDIIKLNSEGGICLEELTDEAMSKAISTILSRKINREESSMIYSKYNWDWCAQKVFKVYQSAINYN